MRAAGCLTLAVMLAVASAPAAHQQEMASRTLLATVSAGSRQLVDLEPDDFVIDEGGSPREVFDVHIADYPLVVLLDNTEGVGRTEEIRSAAARFVSRVGQRAIAVGTLTAPTLLATFDDERADVLAAIGSVSEASSDVLAPLEALSGAIAAVHESAAPFSAIVVVSARAVHPAAVGSPELLTRILDSRIPVHVVAHRERQTGAEPAPDVLRDVADLTRGQYTTIYSGPSYAIALDRLADRLSSEMMVQFLVPPGENGGAVRVGVKVPGARVTGLGVSR